jgi:LmbE family N-acetylglucosaminyl deacetylase
MWLELAHEVPGFQCVDEGSRASLALARWCSKPSKNQGAPRAVIFAAHPDDDVVGLGARLLTHGEGTSVTYLSDGAPINPRFFREAGFQSRAEYAVARSREARAALGLVGIPGYRIIELGLPDQTLSYELLELTGRVVSVMVELQPEIVLTHPYEGGHPDHDAAAFAVQSAVRTLEAHGIVPPALLEFTSYHRQGDYLVYGRFAPHLQLPQRTLQLGPEARDMKRAMLRCHASQTPVLCQFPLDSESFRVAPRYDFESPPSCPVHYDQVDWGVSGTRFNHLARNALSKLGLRSRC